MNNRQHIQKKHPSQSTYTPVQNLYQTRAFDIQLDQSHSSSGQENVDLDADHEQSQYNRYNLPYIPVNAPGTEPPPPIQTQLNSGEPTNYYQQGSADVPWYNRPTYPNIPVNAPGTEPPPPIQTQLNSGEPTNYYQQGSADVPWYNRPTYPNIPVNAPGTEPPPPIQTQLNSGEPTNYYQQGSADVPWYNRPTYPNIPVNAPGTEPPPPIQTKLTIGEPGDKYEQEADLVASQVVQQINSPVSEQSAQGQTVQREDAPPEEEEQVQAKSISDTIQREEVAPFEEEQVQAKSISDTIQREEVAPFEEEQVQAKSISDTIQRQEKPDLEASINQARGGGQAMGDNIRKPMEEAFGADFGGVKVHTDSRSDQLNQSIQARAFTTGQDVFFRQGEYNPGSRGGQELLAHELTHVVQQSGRMVQNEKEDTSRTDNEKAATDQAGIVQPMLDNIIMRASLYRGMIESGGKPQIGNTARDLGVRERDVQLNRLGKVVPGKGMSTVKGSPNNLVEHRRPPSWGGRGNDPVWEIDENNINGKLAANHDGENHVSITVAAQQNMSLEEFRAELITTQPNWTKTQEPPKQDEKKQEEKKQDEKKDATQSKKKAKK
jgi:hypothetical protein